MITDRAITLVIIAALVLGASCRSGPPAGQAKETPLGRADGHPVGGAVPVTARELIAGRAIAGETVLLLTDRPALVTIDLKRTTAIGTIVSGLDEGERPWGLAWLVDNTLWTLLTPDTLGQLDFDGRVLGRVKLAGPHLELYGFGSSVILQAFGTSVGEAVLVRGSPRGTIWDAFGPLKTRAGGSSRLERTLVNLVACGATRADEVPCWFADQASVSLVRSDGRERWVDLGKSVNVGDPAVIEGIRHPIRDLFVDGAGDMWVLWTSGQRRGEEANLGWHLSRHDQLGRLVTSAELTTPGRRLLRAGGRMCRMLAPSGRMVDVEL